MTIVCLLSLSFPVFAEKNPADSAAPVTALQVTTNPNVVLVPSISDAKAIEKLFKDSEYKHLSTYEFDQLFASTILIENKLSG